MQNTVVQTKFLVHLIANVRVGKASDLRRRVTVQGSDLKLPNLVEPKQTVEKRRQIDQERIGQPEDKVLDTVDCSRPEFVVRVCKECHALLHPGVEGVCLVLLAKGIVVVFAYKNKRLRGLRVQSLSKKEA